MKEISERETKPTFKIDVWQEEPQEVETPSERSCSARSRTQDKGPSPLCIPCLLKARDADDVRSVVHGLKILVGLLGEGGIVSVTD